MFAFYVFSFSMNARSYDETITVCYNLEDYEIKSGAILCKNKIEDYSTHTKDEGWLVIETYFNIFKRKGVTVTGWEYWADEAFFMDNVALDSTWYVVTSSYEPIKASQNKDQRQKTRVDCRIMNSGQMVNVHIEPFTYDSKAHTLWFAKTIKLTLHIEEEEQGLLPFVSEGKRWLCANDDGEYSYEIGGDTILYCMLFKQLWRIDQLGNRCFFGGLYESGTNVIIRLADNYFYQRLYMFGIKEEDGHFMYKYRFPRSYEPIFNAVPLSLMDEDRKVNVEGVARGYVELKTFAWIDGGEKKFFYWIEGIGSLYDPFEPRTWQEQTSKLLSCYDGETCLYDSNNPLSFNSEAAINKGCLLEKVPAMEIFDLTGRRLLAPPARGLYIEDGKVRAH